MYFLYLDESGQHNLFSENVREESRFFILSGIILCEEYFFDYKKEFQEFKESIFPNKAINIPIHAADLNNISMNSKSKFKGLMSDDEGRAILKECYNFLSKAPLEALAVIVDTYELVKKHPETPHHPYFYSYKIMLEKFSKIVYSKSCEDPQHQIGMVNLAETSNGRYSKVIRGLHGDILSKGTYYLKDYTNIHPELTIKPMETCLYYQLADLVTYAFQRAYYKNLILHLYDKEITYEGYLEIIKPICPDNNPGSHYIDGVRVKITPKPRWE